MKKSLLTLTLLVGFAPVVIAKGTEKSSNKNQVTTAAWYTRAWNNTKAGGSSAKAHIFNNKKYYIAGTSALGLSGLGYVTIKNPRTVRSVVKSTKRFGRRGLSFVQAYKLATLGSTAALVAVGLGIWKREQVKAFGTKWVVNPTKNVWAKRPAFLWNKSADKALKK